MSVLHSSRLAANCVGRESWGSFGEKFAEMHRRATLIAIFTEYCQQKPIHMHLTARPEGRASAHCTLTRQMLEVGPPSVGRQSNQAGKERTLQRKAIITRRNDALINLLLNVVDLWSSLPCRSASDLPVGCAVYLTQFDTNSPLSFFVVFFSLPSLCSQVCEQLYA